MKISKIPNKQEYASQPARDVLAESLSEQRALVSRSIHHARN